MGSGLGSMSKLTNRMGGGQSVGGVGAVCGCLGVLQGKGARNGLYLGSSYGQNAGGS